MEEILNSKPSLFCRLFEDNIVVSKLSIRGKTVALFDVQDNLSAGPSVLKTTHKRYVTNVGVV